jgi:hypothetical protein
MARDDMALFNTVLFLSKIYIYVFRHLETDCRWLRTKKALMESLTVSGHGIVDETHDREGTR